MVVVLVVDALKFGKLVHALLVAHAMGLVLTQWYLMDALVLVVELLNVDPLDFFAPPAFK